MKTEYEVLDPYRCMTKEEVAGTLDLLSVVSNMYSYFNERFDLYDIDRRYLEFWILDILKAFKPISDSSIVWDAIRYDNDKINELLDDEFAIPFN